MIPEKRLYIILPDILDVKETGKSIPMSCGRLIAQAVHVGSKLKLAEKIDVSIETTTIVLKVCHSKDLVDILERIQNAKVSWQVFLDTNMAVYETSVSQLTAIACYCSRKKGKSLFHFLSAWRCDDSWYNKVIS